MRGLLFGLVALMAFGAGPARSADMPVKAPVYVAPAFNWTGFYIGGFAGEGWGGSSTTYDPTLVTPNGSGLLPFGAPYDCPFGPGAVALAGGFAGPCRANYGMNKSFMGGGTAGYNWQRSGSPWVLGFEAEVGSLRLTGNGVDNATAGLPCSLTGPFLLPPSKCNTFFNSQIGDWYTALTGRVGFAWDRALFYGKFGAGFVRESATVSDTCSVAPCGAGLLYATGSQNVVAWVAGGGLEYAVGYNWSVKAEYLYLGLGSTIQACGQQSNPIVVASFGAQFCSYTYTHDVQSAKIGLNYRFGSPL